MKRIILGISLIPLLFACSNDKDKSAFAPPAIPIVATEVQLRDVPLYIDAVGSIKAAQTVEIRPQVSGMLLETHFNDGDQVKKGDPLFTIDATNYVIKQKEAESQLAQDKISLDSAQKKYERYEKLMKKELIPQQEWEEIQASLEKGKAVIFADEVRLQGANRDVDHCTIEASIDGTIGRANVDPGNLITEQSTLLASLSSIDTLYVDFALTEKEFVQLQRREGLEIQVSPLCGIAKKANGTISYVDHQFNPKNGMVEISAKIDNKGREFLPGQGVKVLIPIHTIAQAKLLPQKSVKVNQSGPYVYVVQADDSVAVRQVELGDEEGEDVIVLEGVEPGEKVVVEGHLRLAPGMKVTIKGSGAES